MTLITRDAEIPAYEIYDAELAASGEAMLATTRSKMPVLELVGLRLQKNGVFKGIKIAMCLHATDETAILALILKAAGADVYLTGSNPKTINDPVMAALAINHGIHVYANSETAETSLERYWGYLLEAKPNIIADDGATLLGWIYGLQNKSDIFHNLLGSTEQTTAGVNAIQELVRSGQAHFPIINVNDSNSKYMFDNQFGVGQSFALACSRIDSFLFSGKTFVICGFGWCGRGAAQAISGLGANVIITEIDPFKALEAYMLGYRVMPIREAVKHGDVFATFTGSTKVIDLEAMRNMRSGAIVMNCGSGTTEVDVGALKESALSSTVENEYVTSYLLPNGVRIRAVCDGRVANIACVGGNVPEIMDLSFSIHATALEYLVLNHKEMANGLHRVPDEVDEAISKLKLLTYGIAIDVQTREQIEYAARYAHLTQQRDMTE